MASLIAAEAVRPVSTNSALLFPHHRIISGFSTKIK
jgi:hypothetical protein